ncbi:MAG: hypothetical protein ACUVXJ_07515 [Phycisphaerae bacterium]
MPPITQPVFGPRILCLLVLAVMVAGGQATAAPPEVLRRWDFDKPADIEGWQKGNSVEELVVADGSLHLTTSHPDAYVFGPPIEVPLDGLAVRVGLRGEKNGESAVYWTTRDDPSWSEKQCARPYVVDCESLNQPGGFVDVEFALGRPADAGRVVTAFRIDPLNGPSANKIEIDFVELIRKPPVFDTRLAIKAHHLAVGEPSQAIVSIRQLDGRSAKGAFEIEIPGVSATPPTLQDVNVIQPASPGDAAHSTAIVRFEKPGVHSCRARISSEGQVLADSEAAVIVGKGESMPTLPGLRSHRLRLDLVPTPDNNHVGAARWMVVGRLVGWLLPLAEITVLSGDVPVTRCPVLSVARSSPEMVSLNGQIPGLPNWEIEILLSLRRFDEHEAIEIAGRLQGPKGGQVLDFSVPVLRTDRDPAGDPIDRYAIFGGLEFLEPGWSSSSDRAVGDRFADRWSPHHFKITLPTMAVEAGRMTSALVWQPTASGPDVGPCATFASPNFLDGQSNHLMKLSVPAREENESLARRPYTLTNDRLLTIQAVLVAEPDVPVAMAARWWYDVFGAPAPPPRHYNDRQMYDLIARSLGETMYWPQEKGWRHHWYMDKSSHYSPQIAATLIGHSIETGQTQWVDHTGQKGKQIIDAAVPLSARLAHEAPSRNAMAAMRPDGTWPFTNTEEIRKTCRELTQGKYDSLGEDGSTCIGTCVQQALPILKYAHLTGSQPQIDAALKALDAMRRFRVPRGAQVWEVHQQIPDIRAAALATEAYRLAYEITANPQWLEDASYWAWCGVPFVYSWHVPIEDRGGFLVATRDRDDWNRHSIPLAEAYRSGRPQVTPYGTVPVLGPTFYVVNWFGVLVQWCGLEWAQHVIELDTYRPDPLLRYIADGVVLSGLQQMMDRQPWIGLYPDSWHTQTNIAYPALIYPGLLMRCLQAQNRLPDWSEPWTRIVRDELGHRRWHVSSWGKPVEVNAPVPGGPWHVKVAFPPGQDNELLVTNVDKPLTVRVGQDVLVSLASDAPPTALGWRYHDQRRAMVARFRQTLPTSEIRVTW